MTIKIRNTDILDTSAAEKFINEMVDKPYGINERIERITISIDGGLYDKLDDIVRSRKRQKQENRTISALLREAVEFYLSNTNFK